MEKVPETSICTILMIYGWDGGYMCEVKESQIVNFDKKCDNILGVSDGLLSAIKFWRIEVYVPLLGSFGAL